MNPILTQIPDTMNRVKGIAEEMIIAEPAVDCRTIMMRLYNLAHEYNLIDDLNNVNVQYDTYERLLCENSCSISENRTTQWVKPYGKDVRELLTLDGYLISCREDEFDRFLNHNDHAGVPGILANRCWLWFNQDIVNAHDLEMKRRRKATPND